MLIVNVEDLIHNTPEVVDNIQDFISVEQPIDYSTRLRWVWYTNEEEETFI